MGKIVAIGGGSVQNKETDKILRHIRSLCKKENPKVIFLPTAAYDDDDDLGFLQQKFGKLGCTVTQLLLTDEDLTSEQIREEIITSDIVYAGGGNLKFLMDTFKARHADEYLREAYENGTVLSGTSSGAMCWFERGYDDCGENHEFIFVDCIGLLPYCNCPHFENKNWRKFRERVKEQELPGIAVEGRAALSFCDGEFKVIRSKPGRTAYFLVKNRDFELLNLARKKAQKLL